MTMQQTVLRQTLEAAVAQLADDDTDVLSVISDVRSAIHVYEMRMMADLSHRIAGLKR